MAVALFTTTQASMAFASEYDTNEEISVQTDILIDDDETTSVNDESLTSISLETDDSADSDISDTSGLSIVSIEDEFDDITISPKNGLFEMQMRYKLYEEIHS